MKPDSQITKTCCIAMIALQLVDIGDIRILPDVRLTFLSQAHAPVHATGKRTYLSDRFAVALYFSTVLMAD